MGLVLRGASFCVATGPVRDWYNMYWDLAHGCTKVSPGCEHCSAAEVLGRMEPDVAKPPVDKPAWTGTVKLFSEAIHAPCRWRGPKLVFVCPWSDVFHEAIPDRFRDQVWAMVRVYSEHRFVLSTKRSEAMRVYIEKQGGCPANMGLLVSVESNAYRHRIDDLLQIKAGLRGVSAEPLLGPLDIRHYLGPDQINWVLAGPELGMAPRPCDVEWMRTLRDDAAWAGVPFFTKHELDGRDHFEGPL